MPKEYIDKSALYEKIAQLEEIARNRYLETPSNSPCYSRYMAQLIESTDFKHIIADFQAADVAPVVRCQNCMYWTKMKDSAQGRCALLCHYPTGGWYCANGERKEDA